MESGPEPMKMVNILTELAETAIDASNCACWPLLGICVSECVQRVNAQIGVRLVQTCEAILCGDESCAVVITRKNSDPCLLQRHSVCWLFNKADFCQILVAYLISIAKMLSFEKQHVGVKYLFH